MMRPTILSLLVTVTACGSSNADGNAGDYSVADVREYVAARAAHQRWFDTLWMKPSATRESAGAVTPRVSFDSIAKRDQAWVMRYRPQLHRIVGPLEMTGLTDSVTTNIGALSGPHEGTSAPDGFIYRTTDSVRVFVSDTMIFRAWVTSEPSNLAELLRNPDNMGAMFLSDAGSSRCADLPVSSKTKQVIAAMLVEYSQDPYGQCQPNAIVVTAVVGHRVIAAQKRIPDSLASDRRRAIDLAKAMIDRLPDR